MTESYRDLEILVAKIQRSLSPDAEVTHNAKILGRSGTHRQIDVLVTKAVGQFSIRIAIECKDLKRPADVKVVEEFSGLLQDVSANHGALVCPRGFTATAKMRAKDLGLDVYSPVDTDPHKRQVKARIPVICDFRSAAITFGISCSSPIGFEIPYRFYSDLVVYDENEVPLGNCFDKAIDRWNKGDFPAEPGFHEKLPIFPDKKTRVDNGYGTLVEVRLYAGLHVERRLFYGFLPLQKISGLKDELTGLVWANAFEAGLLDPTIVESEWLEIEKITDAPAPVTLVLQGLVGWVPDLVASARGTNESP